MNFIPIFIDMTPWARGPHTGVGLTAHHSFTAIQKQLANPTVHQTTFKLQGVSRVRHPNSYPSISLLRRWLGWSNSIYHSFELKLLPVKKSHKVLTVHDLWSLYPNPFQSPSFQKTQGHKLRKSILKADHIAVPSESVREQLNTHFPALKTPISVVPWGPSVPNQNAIAESVELKNYLSQQRPFILCVATLEKRKNYEGLLESFKPELAQQVDLVTVGQLGFGGEEIHSTLQSMRRKYLKGIDLRTASPADLQALYHQCKGLVLVSQDEGFGIPVLEALSFGKPIIASNIGSLKEIAGDRAKYISLSHGAEELSVALKNLLNTPWNENDVQTSKNRAAQFSWENTARKTLEIYQSLIETN